MGFEIFEAFGEQEKRSVFVACSILGLLFLVACLNKWILWLFTAFFIFVSVWMGYKLFLSKTERNRLKDSFKTATGTPHNAKVKKTTKIVVK